MLKNLLKLKDLVVLGKKQQEKIDGNRNDFCSNPLNWHLPVCQSAIKSYKTS